VPNFEINFDFIVKGMRYLLSVVLLMKLRWGARFSRFCDDTYGGMTAFTVTVFLVMMVSVGMAVDFMRHETYRAELQDALDRCVLASASFSQTISPQVTCEGYLKSTNFVPSNTNLNVPAPVETTGTRVITATASYQFDTFFLKLVGIPTLDVHATGSAAEAASKIEIALALDISTSMSRELTDGSTETRLEVLQRSAALFVDEIFNVSNVGNINISLIPFAGQVNVGRVVRNNLVLNNTGNQSRCVEFEQTHFTYVKKPDTATYSGNHPSTTSVLLPGTDTLAQMQHFQYSGDYYTSGISAIDWGWCPSNAQEIQYFETDPEILKTRISNLVTHEATGTQYGMKWAATLLDPSATRLSNRLIGADILTEDERGLPRSYDDPEVQKYIVIMSDGDTTGQSRIKSEHYQPENGDGSVTENEDRWWRNNLPADHSQGYDVFEDIYNVDPFDIDPAIGAVDSEAAARQALRNVCDAAKENGVIIFTLGFDLVDGSTAQDDMAYCATSADYFKDVEGLKLSSAFSEIVSTIQKLKLLN